MESIFFLHWGTGSNRQMITHHTAEQLWIQHSTARDIREKSRTGERNTLDCAKQQNLYNNPVGENNHHCQLLCVKV